MAVSLFKKRVFKAAAGMALAIGVGASAQASMGFTVSPGAIGVIDGASSFSAISMMGISSELVHTTYNSNHVVTGHAGTGVIVYNLFGVGGFNTHGTSLGQGSGYYLYALFQFTDTIGVAARPSAIKESTLKTLTYQLYADTKATDVFTSASLANGGTEASVVVNGAEILLGTGVLSAGTFAFTDGAVFNATMAFVQTPKGKLFFSAPTQFFPGIFNAFINTAQDVATSSDGRMIAIGSAAGTTNFDFPTPEPTSVALLGIGLLALGYGGRHRRH